MDPSTEYKKHRVDKSSETPWSPEHERRRLRERAGTIYRRSQYLSLIHISEPTRPY